MNPRGGPGGVCGLGGVTRDVLRGRLPAGPIREVGVDEGLTPQARTLASIGLPNRAPSGNGAVGEEEGTGDTVTKQSDLHISVADAMWIHDLSEEELLRRLRDTEDQFVERKTQGDKKDWLLAAVALANSTPVGYPAILFIGVRNDGRLEPGPCNFESLQRSFSRELNKAYPPIYCLPRMLRQGQGECLAVIVPGSPSRPHFAGKSYVRVGSETKEASEEQFSALIAERNSKAYEIRKWIGKTINLRYVDVRRGEAATKLIDCNQFYLTHRPQAADRPKSIPLHQVEICHDHEHDTLELEVYSSR